MGELTEIEKYAQAPWVHCPSLQFEELGRLKDSDLLSSINQQIKDCMYSRFYSGKISEIWIQFERLVNSILNDLHTIVDDDTCTMVRIGTLNALQPKWLVLRKMYESVKNLGYSECHIFADRFDLLLFYGNEAEIVVNEILEYIDCVFGNDQLVDPTGEVDIVIEERTVQNLYSTLFSHSPFDDSFENYKTFLTSLEDFPFLLKDCAYAQTYYLQKNAKSLYNNVERFQQHEFGIFTSRQEAFLRDFDNVLKTLGRKEGVPNPKHNPQLLEEAFSITIQKSFPEAYALYEANRGKLESLNDPRNYSEEGWLQLFFSDIFQTHYKGEERDADRKLTNVFINPSGNTVIEGKSGWERWIDFLTVISLVREYEQEQTPTTSNGVKHKKIKTFLEFIKDTARTEEIIEKLHHLVGNQTDSDALKVIAKAMWIDWIHRPTATSIKLEFPTVTCSATIISRCLNEPKPTLPSMIKEIREEFEQA